MCLPIGYHFETAVVAYHDNTGDIDEVCKINNKIYLDINVLIEDGRGWILSSVFDNGLWIFIVEEATNQFVALSIATYDGDIKEGYLEWIQVRPNYGVR